MPVGYFYDGISGASPAPVANDMQREERGESGEILARRETLDLIKAYYQLGERPRRRLLDLANSLNGEHDAA